MTEAQLPVRIEAAIAAPLDDVWDFISDFAGLQRWHPLVQRCDVEGSGVGMVRTVHFTGWWASERLDQLDERQHTMAYSIIGSSREAVVGVRGRIQLTSAGPRSTLLEWTSGLEDHVPQAAAVNAELATYYPVRIGHLKAALGLPVT